MQQKDVRCLLMKICSFSDLQKMLLLHGNGIRSVESLYILYIKLYEYNIFILYYINILYLYYYNTDILLIMSKDNLSRYTWHVYIIYIYIYLQCF